MAQSELSSSDTVVIVGAGLAGAKSAEALRDKGFTGNIVLVGSERHLPYERPPLTKEFLLAKSKLADFTVHDAAWYAEQRIPLHLGETVTEINRDAKQVSVSTGDTMAYDKLILATGSSSRTLPIAGADADHAMTIRSFDDAAAYRSRLSRGSSLAVIGAGWIGLEATAAARAAGVSVTVVESAELPLLNALGREAAQVFADLHREHGVDLRFNTQVESISTADGRATGVRFKDGTHVDADTVLIGVGAKPNIELAERAGLEIADGGVAVSASLQTSDPDIYAVGDIAAALHPFLPGRVRTEHWANALNQPAVAAEALLSGEAAYDALPYFFTDQYDLGMEYVGHAPSYDHVVFRGDVGKREFIVFWLDAGRHVLAGMNVNVWDVTDDVKKLIRSRSAVDEERLADPRVPLADLV